MLGIPADLAAVRTSGVLTDHAVSRLEAEPSEPPLDPLRDDVAVGALVRSRLGNEVADRLVEPLLGGVLRRTRGRDLVAGGDADRVRRNCAAAARSCVPRSPSSRLPIRPPVRCSRPSGAGSVRCPARSPGPAGSRCGRGVTVRAVHRTATGFALECGAVPESERIECERLIIATPPAKAARLLRDVAPSAAAELGAIESASVALVTFAFRAPDLPEGSGLLVGAREGLAVKGVTLSTQKWALDTDLAIVRASLGRAGDEIVLQRSDDELTALARRDLQLLLGIRDQPIDAIVTRWGGGLPQYAVGHVDRVARIRASVAEVPGLAVCGAAYDGVGIPAVIASAQLAAQRVRAQ